MNKVDLIDHIQDVARQLRQRDPRPYGSDTCVLCHRRNEFHAREAIMGVELWVTTYIWLDGVKLPMPDDQFLLVHRDQMPALTNGEYDLD